MVVTRRGVLAAAGAAPTSERASGGTQHGETPARGMERALDIVNLDRLEDAARAVLDPALHDWAAGGAGEEWSLRRNRDAFAEAAILPRTLTGAGPARMGLELLGQRLVLPLIVAPTGYQGLAHPGAEPAAAAGAAGAGALYTAPLIATRSLEDVATAAAGPRWFQIYFQRDRGVTLDLARRAEAAGFGALVVTVDAPVGAVRERDLANRYAPPEAFGRGNQLPAYGEARLIGGTEASLGWDDVAWLRARTRLPLVLKGILAPADAAEAARIGADAVWISNHGGRQLDGAPAGFDVLPRVAEAVGGRVPLLLDGGVRRGGDVFKALTVGADAVAVGRPAWFALALGGAAGVRSVLARLGAELAATMRLAGCDRLAAIAADRLLRR